MAIRSTSIRCSIFAAQKNFRSSKMPRRRTARPTKAKWSARSARCPATVFIPAKISALAAKAARSSPTTPRYAARARALREHGSTVRYYHDEVGYNYRMEGIQGATLGVKLKHLAEMDRTPPRHRARFIANCSPKRRCNCRTKPPYAESACHCFVVRHPRRDELKKHLEANGVGCALHYPLPLHLQKCYASLGYKPGDFPVAEKAARECLSLPIYPELTDRQVQRVTDVIKGFFKK